MCREKNARVLLALRGATEIVGQGPSHVFDQGRPLWAKIREGQAEPELIAYTCAESGFQRFRRSARGRFLTLAVETVLPCIWTVW